MPHHYHKRNTKGTDYAVGDIHGAFPALERKLQEIGFDKSADRLFATGDLVDKGLYSRMAYNWLQQDWFFSAMGNHDMHVANWGKPTKSQWLKNYGVWFARLKDVFKLQMQEQFAKLPMAITIDVGDGFVGIVHADSPFDTWYEALSHIDSNNRKEDMNKFLYSRVGFNHRATAENVRDLKALVLGHSPLPEVENHANLWFMDTDAYKTGDFKLLNLHTLEVI